MGLVMCKEKKLKSTYSKRPIEFAACRNAIQMAAHGDRRDTVVLALEHGELAARRIDEVPDSSQFHHLVTEPVSRHLVLGAGAKTRDTAGRWQTVLGRLMDVGPVADKNLHVVRTTIRQAELRDGRHE